MENKTDYNGINIVDKLTELQNLIHVGKDKTNTFGKYKYRSCEDILEEVKPALQQTGGGIIISDCVKEIAGIIYVEATATYTYGVISVDVTAQAGIDLNKKGMDMAQSFGSSSSYARKYALSGLLLLDDRKDSDATNTHGKDRNWKNAGSQDYQNLFGKFSNQMSNVKFEHLGEDVKMKLNDFFRDCMSPDKQPTFEELELRVNYLDKQYEKL